MDGYYSDSIDCYIMKLHEEVKINVVAEKENFTDDEWEDEGYNPMFDEIWKHEFVKVD